MSNIFAYYFVFLCRYVVEFLDVLQALLYIAGCLKCPLLFPFSLRVYKPLIVFLRYKDAYISSYIRSKEFKVPSL
jgi:hypothetical protein